LKPVIKLKKKTKTPLHVTIGKREMKGVIRIHKLKKDRQYNRQKKGQKVKQKSTKKSKDRATQPHKKNPEYTQVLQ
jgi:hypothetical protein